MADTQITSLFLKFLIKTTYNKISKYVALNTKKSLKIGLEMFKGTSHLFLVNKLTFG